ncbi:MAG TPA: efflux RND transporter periplasmic adaptor subunit [Kofleriaceae bacterium]|nr:efflux RND transporter periplasmic adaptor subunit [Kofleriaceae bacterium]
MPSSSDRPAAHRGSGTSGSGADKRVVPVQVAVAEKKDFPVWLEGLGSVAAYQQVTVHAQVDGVLTEVKFTEGQTVKKGDVIAQIDPRPFMVQLHNAEGALARDQAQLQAAKADYDRQKNLHEQNLVAQNAVDAAAGTLGNYQGAVKIDQAAIESARLQLDYAAVKAPIDGITGVRQVDAGNLVHATDPNGLVVITAIDPAAVLFTLPQDRLTDITQAMASGTVEVDVFNRDGATLLGKGTLTVLDNQVNASTATMRMKAIVANPAHALWPNAFVKARALVATKKDAVVVPAAAVQQGPIGAFVYIVGPDSTVKMTPVAVAFTQGDSTVLDKGLAGGERVVIEGANQLRNGGKVDTGDGTSHGHRGSGATP